MTSTLAPLLSVTSTSGAVANSSTITTRQSGSVRVQGCRKAVSPGANCFVMVSLGAWILYHVCDPLTGLPGMAGDRFTKIVTFRVSERQAVWLGEKTEPGEPQASYLRALINREMKADGAK